MANDKKFLVKNGLTTQNISFVDSTQTTTDTIEVSMINGDTLSFSGDSGQLFSVTDSMSGVIFAVNDISGIPSIEVEDTGTIRFAETFGNVLVGTSTDNGQNKLQITGNTSVSGTINANNVIISGNLTVSGTTTFINTNTLNIGDNIITLNADLPGATAPSENAGIEINRGSSANVSLLWDESVDRWTVGSFAFQSNGLFIGTTQVVNSSGQWVGDVLGLQGIQGRQGVQGTTGQQGTQGIQGTTGTQGTQGIQGRQGVQGTTGQQGTQGIQGTTGQQGTQGIQGQQGVQGTQGIQGTTGTQGIQGSQGIQGRQGVQGTTGTQGTQGIQGTTGIQGSQGIQGRQGIQGLTGGFTNWTVKTSNYTAVSGDRILANTAGGTFTITLPATPATGAFVVIADANDWSAINLTVARNGSTIEGIADDVIMDIKGFSVEFAYDGTTWEIYTAVGVQGTQGTNGAQGTQGLQGIQGRQGITGVGTQGTQGITGVGTQGTQGITGAGTQGTQGIQGLQGIQGRQGITGVGTQGTQGITGAGTQGTQGIQGRQGLTGAQGITGAGTQGTQGIQGRQGLTGVQGIAGSSGSVTIADDTTTNATRYVGFVSATSGTATTLNVSSTKLYFNPSTGTLNATVFNSLSDETLKTDLSTIDNPLEMINNINGYKFRWKDNNEKSIGIMAQELENILPELVSSMDYKSVNYNGLIPVIIEAIKQLTKEIRSK